MTTNVASAASVALQLRSDTAAAGAGVAAYDATTPEDREAILRLVHHYESLSHEVHLPLLDGVVLDKYILQPLLVFVTPSPSQKKIQEESSAGVAHTATVSSIALSDTNASMSALDDHHEQQRSGDDGVYYLNLQEARQARDQALQRMVALVTAVSQHKQKTLEVLEAIVKRDEAWRRLVAALKSCAQESTVSLRPASSGDATTMPIAGASASVSVSVEAAALVQHAMFSVQRSTLHVIERIVAWREGLSLPHPFMVGTENYLLRIISDTAFLATSREMEAVIPMQSLFFKFPLCSNLPSLARFAQDPAKPNFSLRATQGYGPVADGNVTKRLMAAEKVLLEEVETQLNVVRQLLDLCHRHRFLPVLQLKKLYPQAFSTIPVPTTGEASTAASHGGVHGSSAAHLIGSGSSALRGIPVHNASLQQKLETLLLHQLETLRNPPFRAAYLAAKSATEQQQPATETVS